MRRTKEEAELTRATVLKAALSVFSAKGYAAATLDDIATAAKVTRGAIYWHFKGKADLYDTLIRELSDRGQSLARDAAAEGGSLLEVLRLTFVRACALIEDDEDARAVMELGLFKTAQTKELAAGRSRQLKAGLKSLKSLADTMARGIDQGVLRDDIDPADMARTFIAFQNGVTQLWLLAPTSFSLKASAPAFADVLISGLKA
jgi:TetR/AcrR family acrAB operon transcriptional repressor